MNTQTLVSILEKHPAEFIADREIAEHLVSVLRCENCKHWHRTGASNHRTDQATGYCLGDDAGRNGWLVRDADFFCALFEEKQ